jgi:hypothetical protein
LTIDVHLVSGERGGGCHGVISADHLIGNNALRANVAGGEKLNATQKVSDRSRCRLCTW